MDPLVADVIKTTSGVVLGWALGLASALLIEWWKKYKQVRAIKMAVSRELRELAHRLLFIVYVVERRQGNLNRQLLEWIQQQIQRYVGPNPSEKVLAAVGELLKKSDPELAAFAAYEKANTPPSFFPREEASYATAAVAQVHEFAPEYAVRLLDILSHVRMFNEARENGLYYFRLTFAPGVTTENWTKAVQNVDATDEQLARRARIIVDKITALEEKYPA